MSQEITIPSVGESITSVLLSRWHHADGAKVQKGEVIATLETDKVSPEIEAAVSGVLKISVAEGEEVAIGTVIGSVAELEGAEAASSAAVVPVVSSEAEQVDIVMPAAGDSITSGTIAQWAVSDQGFVRKGETVLTVDTDKVSQEIEAQESGIVTIELAEGSEVEIGQKLGSITVAEAELETGAAKSSPSPSPSPVSKTVPAPLNEAAKQVAPVVEEARTLVRDEGRVTRKKMTPLRRKISQHLVNAQQTAAILTTFNEVDMTAVMALRKSVQEDFVAKHGVKLGFMSLFTKAVVQALKDVPSINASIEGNEIVQNHFYDVGIAIGTEKGLIVPVVRDCEQKSFAQIEKDIIGYATKAKEGKIELSDLSGGVFTISNGGVYGSLLSTPILNPPQSGILGMHTIQQRPMAIDGEVKIRPMMYLAMSYDHRLVDGKEAVTFLIKVKDCLENPTRMMLEM